MAGLPGPYFIPFPSSWQLSSACESWLRTLTGSLSCAKPVSTPSFPWRLVQTLTWPSTSSGLSDHAPSVQPDGASFRNGQPFPYTPSLLPLAAPPVRGHVALSYGSGPPASKRHSATVSLGCLIPVSVLLFLVLRLVRGHRALLAGGQREWLYLCSGTIPPVLTSLWSLPSPSFLNLRYVHGGDHGTGPLPRGPGSSVQGHLKSQPIMKSLTVGLRFWGLHGNY